MQILMTAFIVLLPQARWGQSHIYADSHDSLYIVLLPVAALGASDASVFVRAFLHLLLSLSSPLSFTFVN